MSGANHLLLVTKTKSAGGTEAIVRVLPVTSYIVNDICELKSRALKQHFRSELQKYEMLGTVIMMRKPAFYLKE